jgi:hypothetical protein
MTVWSEHRVGHVEYSVYVKDPQKRIEITTCYVELPPTFPVIVQDEWSPFHHLVCHLPDFNRMLLGQHRLSHGSLEWPSAHEMCNESKKAEQAA